MILLNNVLVAVDFGETSRSALTYGVNLSRAFGGRLHVIHVADVIPTSASQFYPEGPGDPEGKARELAAHQLQAVLAAAGVAPNTASTVRVSSSPAAEVCGHAKDIHADLIIVGTHGRSGVSRLLMGSVAERVVRSAPCPVLVVRPNEHEFVVPEPVSSSMRVPR
jgi:nucleotide-binding universal stress UspA family protein